MHKAKSVIELVGGDPRIDGDFRDLGEPIVLGGESGQADCDGREAGEKSFQHEETTVDFSFRRKE